MESLKVIVFKDDKSASYGPPMVFENRGIATRWLSEQTAQPLGPNSPIWCKHPQDFTFMEIGEYDPRTGILSAYESKSAIGLVSDFKS